MPTAFLNLQQFIKPDKDLFMDQIHRFPKNNNRDTGHQADTGGNNNHPGIFTGKKKF